MTNEQFVDWRKRHFRSKLAAARALELGREVVDALERGRTRKGSPYSVPNHIALACAAWTIGLREYAGGTVAIG